MGGATRFLMLLTTTTTPPLLQRRSSSLLRFSRLQLAVYRNYYHLPSSLPLPLLVPSSRIKASHNLHTQTGSSHFAEPYSSLPPRASHHPWPEWSNFVRNLSANGYFNRQSFDEEFFASANLPEDFVVAANACLTFARERPDILGMLSKRDIEVVAEKGVPFLFKNGDDSGRKMKSFLVTTHNNVQNADSAHTIDLVRFLVSYAGNIFSSEKNNFPNRELVESSVRNLLCELAQLSYPPQPNLFGSAQNQSPDRYRETSRPFGQNIEMKRGDWICPRCNFMNFARNLKCLECEEARPKRQLTGGEWECPQCDFFNYGKNMACLRCDCKRPGISAGINSTSDVGYGIGSNTNKADVDSRLAANEEKAQRWFSKISQLDGTADTTSAIADEDFPEIMPLRKGVNRFVVSTRKTPLERRLVNAQNRRNLGIDGPLGNSGAGTVSNLTSQQSANPRLDEIMGQKMGASESDNKNFNTTQNSGANAPSSASSSTSPQHAAPRGSNSAPFVPLPADMFAKKPDEVKTGESERLQMDNKSLASNTIGQTGAVTERKDSDSSDGWPSSENENSIGLTLSNGKEREQAEKSERWFKRVAELHNITDLASAIRDDDFPEIMPIPKGENRFVVSKRKDRSLTSPMYKRQMAMEQANDNNFVPFVPFPPNYFAKKDNQQSDGADSTNNTTGETSNSATLDKSQEKLDDSKPETSGAAHQHVVGNQTTDASYGSLTGGKLTQNFADPRPSSRDSYSTRYSTDENISGISNQMDSLPQNLSNSPASFKDNTSGFPSQEAVNLTRASSQSEDQKLRGSWNGKSLEGSAVKEPDPLDMSEEAKAERWFRRVAQIKNISELSEIPDEDFPSIMPMRKGVNRFVVSKRKTPRERRLTSTQYKRNLPIVSSDPVKENDNN